MLLHLPGDAQQETTPKVLGVRLHITASITVTWLRTNIPEINFDVPTIRKVGL